MSGLKAGVGFCFLDKEARGCRRTAWPNATRRENIEGCRSWRAPRKSIRHGSVCLLKALTQGCRATTSGIRGLSRERAVGCCRHWWFGHQSGRQGPQQHASCSRREGGVLLEGMLVVYSRQNSLLLKNQSRNTGPVWQNYSNALIKRNIFCCKVIFCF